MSIYVFYVVFFSLSIMCCFYEYSEVLIKDDDEHLMNCAQAPRCAGDDLAEPTAAAVACADHWKDSI